MAEIEKNGFPFDSSEEVFIKTGKYDRGALSEEWAKYVSSMFTDGYIIEPAAKLAGFEPLKVTAQSGMTVSIGEGTILIKGRMRIFSQSTLLTLDQADSQPRIDLICLRLNLNAEERRIFPIVIKGDPSDTPIEPGYIRDDVIYDIVIAKATVPSNVAKLTQDDIVDARDDTVYCGKIMTSDARELVPALEKLAGDIGKLETVTKPATQSADGVMSAIDKIKLDGIPAGASAIVTGSYTGNGTVGRTITLGFTPKAIIVMSSYGISTITGQIATGGIALPGYNVSGLPSSGVTSWNNSYSALGITTNGFLVSLVTSYAGTNENTRPYFYIAFK